MPAFAEMLWGKDVLARRRVNPIMSLQGHNRGDLKGCLALFGTRLRFTRNGNLLNRDLGSVFPLIPQIFSKFLLIFLSKWDILNIN